MPHPDKAYKCAFCNTWVLNRKQHNCLAKCAHCNKLASRKLPHNCNGKTCYLSKSGNYIFWVRL